MTTAKNTPFEYPEGIKDYIRKITGRSSFGLMPEPFYIEKDDSNT